jgi:hypothetical protein
MATALLKQGQGLTRDGTAPADDEDLLERTLAVPIARQEGLLGCLALIWVR